MFTDPDKRTIIFAHVYEQKVEIAYREPSTVIINTGTGERPPDKVWKDIHEIVDGKLVHTRTINGKHIPEHLEVERFDWEE